MTKFEKAAIYFSMFIIIVLIFLIVFSERGAIDYKELKVKETAILDQLNKIRKENKKFEDEIQRLKTDIEYIKHIAKHEYDMAEQEDLIFKDKNQDKYKANTQKE